jgi:hypothetical protein
VPKITIVENNTAIKIISAEFLQQREKDGDAFMSKTISSDETLQLIKNP